MSLTLSYDDILARRELVNKLVDNNLEITEAKKLNEILEKEQQMIEQDNDSLALMACSVLKTLAKDYKDLKEDELKMAENEIQRNKITNEVTDITTTTIEDRYGVKKGTWQFPKALQHVYGRHALESGEWKKYKDYFTQGKRIKKKNQ